MRSEQIGLKVQDPDAVPSAPRRAWRGVDSAVAFIQVDLAPLITCS